jgi:hypothetical protein
MNGPQKVKRWSDDSIESVQAELSKNGFQDMSGDLGESQIDELSPAVHTRYQAAANRSREAATDDMNKNNVFDPKVVDKMGNRAERTVKSMNKVQRMQQADESSLGADFMDMISNMKNKDGSPKYPNAKLRDGPQPRKPEVSGPPKPRSAPAAHPGDVSGPADWYNQSSGGKRNMGDSKINRKTPVEEAFKEVPTHGKSGKPNPNHPAFAKHDADFKAQQKAMRPPAQPKLTLNDVWRQVEHVIGQIFPDGDPIDWMAPWLEKRGYHDWDIGKIIDRAAKANGYSDMYAYYDELKQQHAEDNAYDAQMGNQ